MSIAGHLVGVTAERLGADLTADLAIGDTALQVDSTIFFDEQEGGSVLIGGIKLDYLPFDDPDDDDADTDGPTELTLVIPSTVAADEGDPAWAYDPTTGEDDPVTEHTALVTLDDRDAGDALPARIRTALVDQLLSDTETYLGKAVELDVVDGELVLVDILGSKRTGAVKGKWLDPPDKHTVSVLGDQTFQLTYRPIPRTEHLRWDGVSQDADQFTRDGWTVTVPDPAHLLRVGDVLTMQYLYTDPTPRPIIQASLEAIANVSIPGGSTSVAVPDEAQVGDLFVFAASAGASFGNHSVACTDPRAIAHREVEASLGGPWPEGYGVAWGILTTLDDIECDVFASDNSVDGLLAIYRTTGSLAGVISQGDLTNTAPVDCVPDPAAGSVGILVAALASSIASADPGPVGWALDAHYGSTFAWSGDPASAHITSGGELSAWLVLWVGVSDA